MKFFCEYCGNRIDAEREHKCPHCGASYRKNATFKKLEEEKKENQKIAMENGQKVLKHVFGVFAFSKIFMLIPIIIFLMIFIIMVPNIVKQINRNNAIKEDLDIFENLDININDNTQQEKITVGFNEYGQTREYKVKVTKYEVLEDSFNRLDNNYEYIKFHLMVENITDERITKEDVYCIVDGVSQTNDFTSGYSDLPMFIAQDLTVKGTATFIVPKNTISYDIRYGDYVTIHIEK